MNDGNKLIRTLVSGGGVWGWYEGLVYSLEGDKGEGRYSDGSR